MNVREPGAPASRTRNVTRVVVESLAAPASLTTHADDAHTFVGANCPFNVYTVTPDNAPETTSATTTVADAMDAPRPMDTHPLSDGFRALENVTRISWSTRVKSLGSRARASTAIPKGKPSYAHHVALVDASNAHDTPACVSREDAQHATIAHANARANDDG